MLAGTEDLRDSYIEHNRTRDLLAAHQTGGTHDASAITTGVLGAARIPTLPGSKINSEVNLSGTSVFADATVTGTGIINTAILGDTSVTGPLRNLPAVSYGITAARRALWIEDSTGRLGFSSSTRTVKQDIAPADLDAETLLNLQIVSFRYIAAVQQLGEDAATEIGLIAEDVADLGLEWLVIRDADGAPQGIHYDLIGLAALAAAQHALQYTAALAARVEALENGAS